MYIYQGVDIIEISKFRRVFLDNRDFVSDIFTENEIDYCQSRKNPFLHFAGRFAAKEASLKALGIGMSGAGIDNTFKEIEIIPTGSGKPSLSFKGWANKVSRKKKIKQLTNRLKREMLDEK